MRRLKRKGIYKKWKEDTNDDDEDSLLNINKMYEEEEEILNKDEEPETPESN